MNATDRLDAIEQRTQAASKGPWVVDPAPISEDYNDYIDVDGPNGGWVARTDPNSVNPTSDAEFIASARQDVPDLVNALRAVLEDVKRFREWAEKNEDLAREGSQRSAGYMHAYENASACLLLSIESALGGPQ